MSNGGFQKILPLLAAGGLGLSAVLLRHKGKAAAPVLPSATALDGNIPQIVTPSYQPDPPPPVILDTGGANQNQVPLITGITNVLDKWGVVPKIFGKRLVFPKLCAEFVLQPRGNETAGLGLFVVGQGAYEITDLKIGDTPVSQFAPTDFAYEILPGDDPEHETVTLFSTDFTTSQLSDTLSYNVYIQKGAPQTAVRLAVEIACPNGLYKKDASGNRIAETVTFDVEYSLAGSGVWTKVPPPDGLSTDPSITHTDNTTQITKKYLEWTVTKGAYLVRIKKLSADTNNGTTIVNTAQWSMLRATGDTPMINPWRDENGDIIPVCYIAVLFRQSEQFNGVIEQLNCVATSKLSTWDGAQWTAPVVTRNNAWAFAEILTGMQNPEPMDKTDLDGTFLKAWADFCTARGFNFDAVYDTETTQEQLLEECCEAGRGSVHLRDGKHCVIFDQKQTVIAQHFTPRNILKDSFQGHGTKPDLPHGVKVRWINPDIGWQQDERIVYADGYSATGTNGTAVASLFERINAPGCTSADQAYRLGRYRLKVAYLRRERYTIGTDWGVLACDRGDLVRLTHDVGMFGFGWGKILELLTNGDGDMLGVRLDTAQEMVDGNTYGIRVRLGIGDSANNSFERELNTTAGTTATLIFASPLPFGTSPAPAVGQQVMFGLKEQESLECLVEQIDFREDYLATLSLVPYAPGIYDVETEAIPEWTTGITTKPKFQQVVNPPVVLNIRSDESVLVKHSDGSLITRVLMTMQAPASNVANFELQYRRSDATTWVPIPLVPVGQGEISVTGLEDGVLYNFQIRNRTANNLVSTWVPLQHLVIGKTTPPPGVTTLTRNGNLLAWTYPDPPLDLAGFRVKFNYGSDTNWASAHTVANLVQNMQWDMTQLPGGPLTVMVAAVDTAGNESTYEILEKDFGDEPLANVLLTHSEAPDFSGTITGGTVVAGVLQADDDGGLFWNGPDSSLFWGGNDSDLFWNDSFVELQYEFSFTPDPLVTDWSEFNLTLDTSIQGDGLKVEYRSAGDSLFWDGPDDSLFWGGDDSDLFWGAEDDWSLWPGQLSNASVQQYDFRITCQASGVKQGKIQQLDVIIDVPDLFDYIDDFLYEPGVSERLTLTKSFRAVKNVQVTLQRDTVNYPDARWAGRLDKDISGPLIIVEDSGGTPTAGIVDAIVKGF